MCIIPKIHLKINYLTENLGSSVRRVAGGCYVSFDVGVSNGESYYVEEVGTAMNTGDYY